MSAKGKKTAGGKLSKQQFLGLAVLFCGSFVAFLNQTLVTPALPAITIDLGITTSVAQWLVSAFTLVNAVMVPITAFLTDKYSARRLFIVAMGLFLGGSLIAAWGPTFFAVLLGRLLQAAGSGIIMPMVMTELMVSFPPEKRGGAMGLFGLVSSVAPTIGPTVAGIIIDCYDWHYIFVLVSLLTFVGLIVGALVLKTSPQPAHPEAKIHKPSLISCCMGLGLMLFGFSSVGQKETLVAALVCIVVGGLIFAYFVRLQLKLEEPMLKLSILKANRFTKATIICMIVQAALLCGPVLMPIYIQTIRGFSATVSGMVIIPGAIVMGLMNPVAGKLFDKYGVRTISIVGLGVLAASSFALCLFGDSTSLTWLVIVMCIRNAAIAFVNMPISTWGMNQLNNRDMNHGTSINNTARMAAGSLGTALIISAYTLVSNMALSHGETLVQAELNGYFAGFAFSGLLCLAAFIMAVFMVKDKKEDAASVDPSQERRVLLSSIMKRDVYVVPDTASVAYAAQMFVEKGISAAPIVNAKGEPIGFISDGDILRALSMPTQEFIDPIMMIMRSASDSSEFDDRIDSLMKQNVSSIAHMGIISVDINDRLSTVCRVLGQNSLKKVPVVDDGKIIGVINRSDIAKYALRRYTESHNLTGLS